MKNLAIIVLAMLLAGIVGAQSVQSYGAQNAFSMTAFPLYGAAVTPHDSTVLTPPRQIRVNADGAVTARCAGQSPGGQSITLTLVAGEFFPCQVVQVLDTGTDAITIHGFY